MSRCMRQMMVIIPTQVVAHLHRHFCQQLCHSHSNAVGGPIAKQQWGDNQLQMCQNNGKNRSNGYKNMLIHQSASNLQKSTEITCLHHSYQGISKHQSMYPVVERRNTGAPSIAFNGHGEPLPGHHRRALHGCSHCLGAPW